jgi:hypothetical protein
MTALNPHAKKLSACPAEWMPWNYQEAVKRQEATGRNRWHVPQQLTPILQWPVGMETAGARCPTLSPEA